MLSVGVFPPVEVGNAHVSPAIHRSERAFASASVAICQCNSRREAFDGHWPELHTLLVQRTAGSISAATCRGGMGRGGQRAADDRPRIVKAVPSIGLTLGLAGNFVSP